MKFAHMADVHLGSWNAHPDLRELPLAAFRAAISKCIEKQADFILIAGDLFDTSLPSMDILKESVAILKKCSDSRIRVYVVPGSHDFSPSGKTMISVLEEAGLLCDVSMKWASDKSGAHIFGMPGKKLCLESALFNDMDIKNLQPLDGFNIFMFHSAVSELFSCQMASLSLESLPKNFDYYASGHIHETKQLDANSYGKIVFPGALFSTGFDELEKNQGSNGFFMVNYDGKITMEWNEVRVCDIALVVVDASGRKPFDVEKEIKEKIENADVKGRILLLKVRGALDGKQIDIDMRSVLSLAAERGAMTVKKSLHTNDRDAPVIESKTDVESEIIDGYVRNSKLAAFSQEKQREIVLSLMDLLAEEKNEDELQSDFEEKLLSGAKKILEI